MLISSIYIVQFIFFINCMLDTIMCSPRVIKFPSLRLIMTSIQFFTDFTYKNIIFLKTGYCQKAIVSLSRVYIGLLYLSNNVIFSFFITLLHFSYLIQIPNKVPNISHYLSL